jgi:exopolysaccharide biosynthesis polyprenyl glycosylphosphotransferase
VNAYRPDLPIQEDQLAMKWLSSLRSFIIILMLGLAAWAPTSHQMALLFLPALGLASLAMGSVLLQRDAPEQHEARAKSADPVAPPSGPNLVRSLIVGAGTVGHQLAESLEAGGQHVVVGFIDDNRDWAAGKWTVLGRLQATEAIIREHDVDAVYLAYTPTWQQELVERLTSDFPDVGVSVVPSPYEALMRLDRVQSRGDIALVSLNPAPDRVTDAAIRAFDLVVALCVLVLLAPVWALVALLVKLTSPGPVIFAQERIGQFGRPFMVLKFRTMRQDAEAATGPILSPGKQDSRLTPIGRYLRMFRIDEVPQLWNVVRGEMSLVGPRPERTVFVEKYQNMVPMYNRRHEVRPGITGLAQICGGYHTDARDKLRFDLIYVSHRSLWFDLSILLRTVLVVVFPTRYGQ